MFKGQTAKGAYGPPNEIGFYGDSDLQNNEELTCSNTGENLTSYVYSCEMGEFGSETAFYYGIGVDLDVTHKCTQSDGKTYLRHPRKVKYVQEERFAILHRLVLDKFMTS